MPRVLYPVPMIFEERKRRKESFVSGQRRDERCVRRRRRVWSWDRRRLVEGKGGDGSIRQTRSPDAPHLSSCTLATVS